MKQLDFFEPETEMIIEECNAPMGIEEEYCCYECRHFNPVSWDSEKGISGNCNFRQTVFLGTGPACYKFIYVRKKRGITV